MKKKSVSKKNKEEELEEEIIEAEKEIPKKEIIEGPTEPLTLTEVKAPVLEKIISQEPVPMPEIAPQEIEREEKEINYVSNEPKYSTGREVEQEERKYETSFIPPVLNQRESIGREEFFKPMRSAWERTEQIAETPEHFERFETERRRLPFEEEQKKYKRVKF